MKNYFLFLLFSLVILSACKKEEQLTPSNTEKNFYIIADNPSDAVDHAIYQFYASTKIPVFLKDTIGVDQRVDPFGIAYTYKEVLKVNYDPNGKVTSFVIGAAKFTNLSAKANASKALDFLSGSVMPLLPAGIAPSSILLTDTLNSPLYGTDAFKGFNTVVMGSVPKISTFNAQRLGIYKAAVLRAIVSPYVLADKNTNYLIANFYSVSRAFVTTGQDVYGNSINAILGFQGKTAASVTVTPLVFLQGMGFLTNDPSVMDYGFPSVYNKYSPPTYLDVNQFIEAIFTYNTAQFTALYGTNAAIMKKYIAMKTLLVQMGFSIS